jgi:hypothetical protein
MSIPRNELDVFSTYTYHFELHAAKSWESLKNAQYIDQNSYTSPKDANGTLLINTRKDAHQTIDDVRITYHCSNQNQYGEFTPESTMSMLITEPNGAFFIEKIHNVMNKFECADVTSLIFGLKIFFVGRTPDNKIKQIEMPSIIPMQILEMKSKFSYKGGEYSLEFSSLSMNTTFLHTSASDLTPSSASALGGYCNKTITLKAKTVQEALDKLQKALNDNYADTYKLELKNPGARDIRYVIKNQGVQGKLSLTNNDSFDPTDFTTIVCSKDESILSWIYKICRSSKELNEKIGASKEGIKKEGHPGVKMISVIPKFNSKENYLELNYEVGFYEGGGDDLYIFDFMFSEPGKNVDVLDFDIAMTSLRAWYTTTSHGIDGDSGWSSRMPKQDPKKFGDDIIVPDVRKDKLTNKIEVQTPPIKKGDYAYLNIQSKLDDNGHIKFDHDSVPSAKLAFSCISDMNSAVNSQVAFTIRGNLELLTRGILHPDIEYFAGTKAILPGLNSPTQIKVNIRSPDSEHYPFFYTGKYGLGAIDNHFSGGLFTQVLYVSMQEPAK